MVLKRLVGYNNVLSRQVLALFTACICNLVVICNVTVKPKARPPDVMKVPVAIDSTSCNKLTNFSGLYDSWKLKELLNSLPMTSFH